MDRALKASETLGTQRRLLMVLVTLLVLVFIFLIILTCLMFIYYSRISEAIKSLRQDTLETIQKEIRQCDSGWKSFDGSCYYIVTTEENWTEARAFCKSMNSNLVIINSEREQKFLENITDDSYFWIGLKRDNDDINGWRWVDGTLHNLSEGFWYEGEPNNEAGTEDCGHLWIEKKWNDVYCTDQYKAICERKLTCCG
ncbi:hepatic lectin-like [Xenopus tropicalis]|uniref:Hepatic lectin-like n=1 Tax=Xenopus tropicalis TaxID=8364 RepID=A0A8J1J8A9_XENTR|nr:hepatic lectin-like [Xenopus tropicalis]